LSSRLAAEAAREMLFERGPRLMTSEQRHIEDPEIRLLMRAQPLGHAKKLCR
jgi:hypothetical protein